MELIHTPHSRLHQLEQGSGMSMSLPGPVSGSSAPALLEHPSAPGALGFGDGTGQQLSPTGEYGHPADQGSVRPGLSDLWPFFPSVPAQKQPPTSNLG